MPSFSSAAVSSSSQPILRLETGLHLREITGLATDAATRFLATSSRDATARIWDVKTGKLLRVLRPPLQGNSSNYAVSDIHVTPDGAHALFSVKDGSEQNIFMFNLQTGALEGRAKGRLDQDRQLIFSPNNKYFAVLLRDSFAVYPRESLFDAFFSDKNKDQLCLGVVKFTEKTTASVAVFDSGDRLAVATELGMEIYQVSQKSVQSLAAAHMQKGNEPNSIAFSPDGKKIAVGYAASAVVSVFAADNLKEPKTVQASSAGTGFIEQVAWSSDGQTLYAGGSHHVKGKYDVCSWSDSGEGALKETPVSSLPIFRLIPLRSGELLYGSSIAWGVLGKNGSRGFPFTAPVVDYSTMDGRLLLAPDASSVQFFYNADKRSQAVFSLKTRTLSATNVMKLNMLPPLTEAPGIQLTEWRDTTTPRLNGKPLSSASESRTNSLAVAQNGRHFVLGDPYGLSLYDRSGALLDRAGAAPVWAVNYAANSQVVVAALGDGSIRWYAVENGAKLKEVLAFFPQADRKRWALWTPSGYYDASAGGEELLGWHVNNGPDREADFFPVSKFRSVYYRPDVIDAVLDALDEAQALKLADLARAKERQAPPPIEQIAPPVIQILAPADGHEAQTAKLPVRYRVHYPTSAPISALKILIDGQPLQLATAEDVEGLKSRAITRQESLSVERQSAEAEIAVPLPERTCTVSLVAANEHAASDPATILVKWRGARSEPEQKPALYVLSVGVSKYKDTKYELNYAAKDAQDVAAAFERQKDGMYRQVTVRCLSDENATKDKILDGLEWLKRESTNRDVAVIFFAGHGMQENDFYYLAPWEIEDARLMRTAIDSKELVKYVDAIPGKRVLFLDSCRSGGVQGLKRRGPNDIAGLVNELTSAASGLVVFSASTSRQDSLEKDEWGNGAFTKALVEGLTGMAADGKGAVRINALDAYIAERVKALTSGRQSPMTAKPQLIENFPLSLARR